MAITITRNGYHRLLDANGFEVSKHTDTDEAIEKAANLPPGTYQLITADKTIVVSATAPAPVPAPIPAPDPPPSPTPDPAPQPDPAPLPPPPPPPAPPSNAADQIAFYESLRARPDCWWLYDCRNDGVLDLNKSSRSKPRDVTYDFANDPDPRRQDAAKILIPANVNSLPNYLAFPFGSEEGHTYAVVFDAWFGAECLPSNTGLQNWKTWQFTYPRTEGGRDTIWAEIQTHFDRATAGNVGQVRMRQYSSTPLDANDGTGSVPKLADFQIAPETWTRYVVLLEVPAFGSGDVLISLWVCDKTRPPVQVQARTPWRRDAPGRIEKFWLEFNTSTDAVAPTRGPLTIYHSSVAILRDPVDLPLSQAGL